ncbi:MAG: SAM-dependent methyltransferase [Chloroflexota bacterium]|nr:SAM-dependent methyltransferase [Chloroflexota bacterium]
MFSKNNTLYRQVNKCYQEHYDTLIESGLYETLVDRGLLISHEEVHTKPIESEIAYKVIQPEMIQFISYPYEWCFSQIRDAALTMLTIQKVAFQHGMTLKDASVYNIQFNKGHPILIDTLSFEIYKEGEPWVAYRQFCQHFLAPLALMSYVDVRLSQLLRVYIDGIPLDLTSRLLPIKSKLNFNLLSHIHLHASSQKHFADKDIDKSSITRKMSRNAFQGLINSLASGVEKLHWRPAGTEWGEYYEDSHNYTPTALEHKQLVVARFLDRIKPAVLWDLGANTGMFSRLASQRDIPTTSFDIDPAAVEINYLTGKEKGDVNLLPLQIDLTNPSSGIGWQNQERASLLERGPVDAVLALALIHHLAIANNVPLGKIGVFFQSLCRWLIIELVPKSDSQVKRLLSTREDIFTDYTQEGFENIFSLYFETLEVVQIKESERVLYLLENKARNFS